MRFTVTMDDDLVQHIDEQAHTQGISRAQFISGACHRALKEDAPDERGGGEVATLRAKAEYQDELIRHLTDDRTWLRGEVSRLQAHNEMLMTRIPQLPASSQGGFWSRLSHRLRGETEKP